MNGFICGPRVYQFQGWFFEDNAYGGPWPLKKNGDCRERAGRKFYKMYDKFSSLGKKEKQKYLIGGGCVQI